MVSSLSGDKQSKIRKQQLESGQKKIIEDDIVKNFNRNGNQTGPVIIREVAK